MSSGIKLTYEYVKQYLMQRGYTLLSKSYENNKQKLSFVDSDGYKYYLHFSGIQHRSLSPKKFGNCNIYKVDNLKLFLKENYPNFKIYNPLELVNTFSKITLVTAEGYKYVTTVNILLRGNTPDKISPHNPYSIHNIKLWCKLNNVSLKLISDNYIKSSSKLKWKCLKSNCKEYVHITWGDVRSGYGCSFCAGRKVGKSNCLATRNPELAKEWHPIKNGALTPNNIVAGSRKRVWWKCQKCNHEWEAVVNSRNGGRGCPSCRDSRMEEFVKEFLCKNCILFVFQKRFSDCKNKNTLSFDFYLPELNKIIETNGKQHYEPIKFFGGKETFKKQQKRDQIKRDYCNENNIELLEIPYWDFDNIEEILIKEVTN